MKTNCSLSRTAFTFLIAATLATSAQTHFIELISPNVRSGGQFGWQFGDLPDLTRDGIEEFYVLGENRLYVYDGRTLAPLYSVMCPGNTRSAGYLTGDGIPDLMTGGGCSLSGAVKFINGTNGNVLFTLTSPNPTADGLFGNTVRLLPDMSGDGKEDWLIHQQEYQSRVGRVYIFDSQTRVAVRTIQNTNSGFTFHMQNVEVIPDANGDGTPELLIGAFGPTSTVERGGQTFSNAGRALVRSLQTGAVLFELIDPEPQANGGFGDALKGVGDITGDGVGDIAIGAFRKDSQTGAIYFFSGANGRWLRTLRSPNPRPTGKFGRRIEVLPDLNDDGVPELWTQEDGFQLTYVFDGATSVLLKTIPYPGVFANLFFTGIVRQQAPPGLRAYLFASEFINNSEGRVYFMPFTPIQPTQLRTLGTTASGFRLQLSGEPGLKLQIQATGDFSEWEPVAAATTTTNSIEITDSTGAGATQRFYRTVQRE